MKRTKMIIGLLLALVMVLCLGLTACTGDEPTTPTGSQPTTPTNGNPTGGVPTNGEPTDPTTKPTQPAGDLSITVTPGTMEIYAGEYTVDDFDLLMGVEVSDSNANLFVSDDEGFDLDVPGTYVITYSASLDGKTATATRTITVLQAKSALAVEVPYNHLGENKWKGKVMSFANAMYVELSADTTLSAQTGIFKNTSGQPIVLNVEGKYGCSAVIDANGVVIEGRDGANGKLVNAQNPDRGGSKATSITIDGEEVSVVNGFAKQLVIPAGGYAIVVQSGAFGDGADADGRGFMNYNVIRAVGTVVKLYWVDTQEILTTYVNQKPVVTGNNKILVPMGDLTFDLNTAILAGLVAKDDNGVFGGELKIEEFTIVSDGGFNINEVGVYTITLSVTDGTLTTEFTREVEVRSDGIGTLFVGEKKMNVNMELVAIDQNLANIGKYAFIIYTPAYKANGGKIEYANGWGIAFIMDEYGVLVRIYDGTGAKYYDAEHPEGVKDGTCTDSGYLQEAYASLKEGETMLVAPNGGDNNTAGGSRTFLLNAKVIGAQVSGIGMNFKTKASIITIGDRTFTAEEGKWLYNTAVTKGEAANYSMIIFDKKFTGTFETNGYGAVVVLDQYGALIKVYDGANLGFYTKDGKAAAHFDVNNYATTAFADLKEGETMIIFPNDGGANGNVARKFALDLRGLDGHNLFGEIATLSGFQFAEKPVTHKTITINGATFTAEEGKWLYNTEVTKAKAANYSMIIYDKNYTGTFETNGYGAVIVLNAYGELVKVYDGANLGFYTQDGKAAAHFTVDNYAAVAWKDLQEGETMIIFPNDGGVNGNVARAFALTLRSLGDTYYFGQVATLTGFEFKKK